MSFICNELIRVATGGAMILRKRPGQRDLLLAWKWVIAEKKVMGQQLNETRSGRAMRTCMVSVLACLLERQQQWTCKLSRLHSN